MATARHRTWWLKSQNILSKLKPKSTIQYVKITLTGRLACEHFRLSLRSLRKIAIFQRERSDNRKCICCSQATGRCKEHTNNQNRILNIGIYKLSPEPYMYFYIEFYQDFTISRGVKNVLRYLPPVLQLPIWASCSYHVLAQKSLISTSPKNFLMSKIDHTVLL